MGGGSATGRFSYAQNSSRNISLSTYTQADEEPKKVFISFHTEDEAQVNLIRYQAVSPDFNLEFQDTSVKKPFRIEWKKKVLERIANSDVVMVPIGSETYARNAVNYEIDAAYKLGKSVVGVRIHRNKKHRIPKALIDNRAQIVNWNMNEISYAIANS